MFDLNMDGVIDGGEELMAFLLMEDDDEDGDFDYFYDDDDADDVF